MRTALCVILSCQLAAAYARLGNSEPVQVSMVQLLAQPSKYDKKLISVRGFLSIWREPHHGVRAILFLHPEDAKDLFSRNTINVVASQEMIREQKTFDQRYVILTGVFHAAPTASGGYVTTIREVQACTVTAEPDPPQPQSGNTWR